MEAQALFHVHWMSVLIYKYLSQEKLIMNNNQETNSNFDLPD